MMIFLNERLFIIVSLFIIVLSATAAVKRDHKWHFLASQLFTFPFSPPKRLQNPMYLHYMSGSTEVSKAEIMPVHSENNLRAF